MDNDQTPVVNTLDEVNAKVDTILEFIEEIRPVIDMVKDKAPEIIDSVGPMLAKVQANPIGKMLGL